MTKREVLTKAAALDVFTEDEKDVLNKMIEQLDKKASKPTKTQIENEGYKADILAVVADGHARTAKEIGLETGLSTAKASALLRALVLDAKVEKIAPEKTKDAPKYVGKE